MRRDRRPRIMRPNLVIARTGRSSLHPRWLEHGAARNWDLLLCPYQDGPTESDFPVPPATPGQKWLGLDQLLNANDIWRRYDYVWMPDDDLMATAEEISRLFDLCHSFNAALAQPALTEESDFSFAMTMRNRAFFARATTFVEIMAPCFRSDVLARLLPTLAEVPTGWGWGLSYVWAAMLECGGIYIFDAAPVWHTRLVGGLRSPEDRKAAEAESARMLSKRGLSPLRRSLHACDEQGARIEESETRFLLRYLEGYEYLFEQHPSLIRRVVADQIPPPPRSPQPQSKRDRRKSFGPWWRRLRSRFVGG